MRVSLLLFFFLTAAGIVVSVLFERTHDTHQEEPAGKEGIDAPDGSKGGFHCLGLTWGGIDMAW